MERIEQRPSRECVCMRARACACARVAGPRRSISSSALTMCVRARARWGERGRGSRGKATRLSKDDQARESERREERERGREGERERGGRKRQGARQRQNQRREMVK